MGARGIGHIAELCAIASPTDRGRHAGRRGAHRDVRHDRRRGPGQGRAGRRPCRPRAPRCSTPATSGWRRWRRVATATVVTYGRRRRCARRRGRRSTTRCAAASACVSPWGAIDVALAVRGRHQVDNALAAAAAALVCGVSLDDVAAGWPRRALSPWRMELATAPSGCAGAERRLQRQPHVGGRGAGVAGRAAGRSGASPCSGVMAELGRWQRCGPRRHRRSWPSELGIRGRRGRRAGLRRPRTSPTSSRAAAALGELGDGDAVLVKGSRVAGLERLATLLLPDHLTR